MSQHFDLEEQEQLAQLKHFWNQYGNLITWVLILGMGGFAAWNGWTYWQRTQAAQAAAMYEELERAATARQTARVETVLADVKERYPRAVYAHQAALLAARHLSDVGKSDGAQAALEWVASSSKDEGYQAVARLRLAALLVEKKAYDDALKQLAGGFPKSFEGLAADRRGDVLSLQNKSAEARIEYTKAYKAIESRAEYRRWVEYKLNALGVDVATLEATAGAKS